MNLSSTNQKTAVDYFNQGNQEKLEGKLEVAVASYQQAIELNPTFSWYYQTLGETLVLLERWEEAVVAYERAIELKPNSAWPHRDLGEVLVKVGRLDEAIDNYRQAIALNSSVSEFYNSLGKALFQRGSTLEAVANYQKAIDLEADSSSARYNLGEALEKQGQIEEAAICYRKALEIDPAFAEAYQKLGNVVAKLGDLNQAAAAYTKASNLAPTSAPILHKLGETLAKLQRWEEAVAAYRKAVELQPNSAAVFHQLGYALAQQQKWDEAAAAYRQATELQPNSPEVHHHLGYALAQQQQWNEAAAAYRQTTELQPNSPDAYQHLGYALSQLKQWEEAVVAYRKAAELQPNSPEVRQQLGRALIKMKQFDWAVGVLRQSLKLNPNQPEVYGDLGEALLGLKKWEQAIATYNEALKLNPNWAEVHGYLGQAKAQQKQWEEAIACYRRALELDSTLAEVHKELAFALVQEQKLDEAVTSYQQAIDLGLDTAEVHHQHGHVLSRLKRWDEAVISYRRAIGINPNSAAVHHQLGEIFAQNQQWEEALTCYQKACQLHPNSADVRFHIGEVMAKLERWDEAIASYQKAIELRPTSAKFHDRLGDALTHKSNPWNAAIKSYQKVLEIDPHSSRAKKKLEEAIAKRDRLDSGVSGSQTVFAEGEFEGCLDYATIDYVSGWARHKTDPEKVVFLDIFVGNNLTGTLVANKYRKDLADAFGTHGYHAFAQKIPPSLHSNGLVEISVKITETGQQLKNSPKPLIVGPKGKKHQLETPLFLPPSQGGPGGIGSAASLIYKQPKKVGETSRPKVAVIILSLNGAKLLNDLFASFEIYNTYENYELVAVDHGSSDNSIEVCNEWAKKLPIKLLARGDNYSFSNSNNVASRESDAPILLFMNNDLTLCQDIIGGMVELIQNDENLGMVGAKLLDIVSDRSLAFPPTQHLGVQLYFYTRNEPFYPYEVRYAPQLLDVQSAPWKVPIVTGALMMCRRTDFEAVGGFNEDYFYGYEDVDLCLCIRQLLGKEIISANHLTAFHHRGFSRFNREKSFIEKILGNRPIIEKRFAYYLRRTHLKDYFEKGMFWTGHQLAIGFAVTEADMAASAGDYFTAYELGEELVKQYGWNVYYLEEGEEWYDMTRLDVIVVMRHDYDLNLIENAKPTLVKVAWARNWFEVWAGQQSAGDYDCFWCSSQKSADYIQEKISKPATVLSIGTNEGRFANAEPDPQYKSDYCFTGSFWKYPRDIAKILEPDALPYDFALYGYNWEKLEKFKKYYRGPLPYTEMPKVYASTKIVVDDANSVTKQWGSTNSRVFDALMAGALVVTNGELGNEATFGGLLPTYNSRESLESVLNKYLGNEELRLAKVAELQQIVKEKHTYKYRANTVFATLREKMSNSFRIAIKIGTPKWSEAKEWGDYHYALAMKRAFEKYGHSVRIDILPEWEREESFGDDVSIVIRGLSSYKPKSYQINLMWNISHPDKVELEEYEQFDCVFVASKFYAEELGKKVKVPVQSLLQCTDHNLFYPDESGNEKVGEVLFVGNSRKVYRQIVKDAVEGGLKVEVYGTKWEDLLPPGYLQGEHIPNEILRRYYSKCGVLLNDHWDTMRQKGFISNRLFDAAACGATIVSDKIDGLEEVFGDKIATYEGAKDLASVVNNCLSRRDVNRQSRLELAEFIRKYHTFEARVDEMMKVIEKLDEEKMQGPENGVKI
jgi:tetratricopeptide (TPR) repeat protein/GT2 family glycosyltransferase/spore maturation protein CgeB